LRSHLGQLAVRLGQPHGSDFRKPSGVYMKMMNFRRFDPSFTACGKIGLTKGNKAEPVVWSEFA
jgi:5-methylcytosine-specific restriction enzyme A